MLTLLVEGWRSYAQSHSIVNQFQCLELLKRGDIRLFHTEAPPRFHVSAFCQVSLPGSPGAGTV